MTILGIRDPTPEDSDFLHELRNAKDVRQFSLNNGQISHTEHEIWLNQRLLKCHSDPFWIIYFGNKSVGYVRFDQKDSRDFEISIAIAPAFRGFGLGGESLALSLSKFRTIYPSVRIIATVHEENNKSLNFFLRAGFLEFSRNGKYLYLEN